MMLEEGDIILTGDDSEALEQIGIGGKILHTPGHSRDSISVTLSDGSAFVGDVAMNFLRITGIGHRPIYIEDIDTVYGSWQTLIEQGARVIYPSHGEPSRSHRLQVAVWRSREVRPGCLDVQKRCCFSGWPRSSRYPTRPEDQQTPTGRESVLRSRCPVTKRRSPASQATTKPPPTSRAARSPQKKSIPNIILTTNSSAWCWWAAQGRPPRRRSNPPLPSPPPTCNG